MKILMVMDPGILVPPNGYGGIERIVEILALEYTRMGHEVHLLVTTGSYVEGCTVYPFGKEGFPPKKRDAQRAVPTAWRFLWQHRNDFDLIHNFGRLAYLAPLLSHPIRKIMSYQREIDNKNIWLTNRLRDKNMFFTACSTDLLSRIEAQGRWEVIYNAINFSKYTLRENVPPDAPLMFLGRIERIKGCHTAIKVAKASGNKLLIAGSISSLPEEIEYYKKEIEPQIDNEQIVYVGALNDEEKNRYLGTSKALIFPIEWNEPFGIVMIEAMACGTPVIGFNRGSVNEVIDEVVTGFKVNSANGIIDAINNIFKIDRRTCRAHAKKRFDASVVAKHYLDLVLEKQKSVVIVTTGQPAANPRVLKEYDALKKAGFRVRVLYAYSAEWSHRIDEKKFESGELIRRDFVLVGGDPHKEKLAYFFSRSIYKICNILSKFFPLIFLKEITFVRPSLFFWFSVSRYKADIYMAHYLGALPAAIRASRKHKSAVVFDAEDFHRGEEPYYREQIADVIDIENRLLPKVNFITAASPLICEAYSKLYPATKVFTINNVFSQQFIHGKSKNGHRSLTLDLFWFSQIIGPNRGLETVIEALNLLKDKHVRLHLLGNPRNADYVNYLLRKANHRDSIQIHAALPPDEIFSFASSFDIGIAAEIPYCENRNICLTNKIFTYLLAGNAILASDTMAQQNFLEQYRDIGKLYSANDAVSLAEKINEYLRDEQLLRKHQANANLLAKNQLNWEIESQKLINGCKELLS